MRTHSVLCFALSVLAVATAAISATPDWEVVGFSDHYLAYHGVACAEQRCVVVGGSGVVVTMSDEASELHPFTTEATLYDVAANGCWFLAVGGSYGQGVILASPDGRQWQEVFRGNDVLRGVTWGDGGWLAVGQRGIVVSGVTGHDWTTLTISTDPTAVLRDVLWDGSQWVAAGSTISEVDGSSEGWVASSSDGASWTIRATIAGTRLHALATDGTTWVAAGDGQKLVSSDLESWQSLVEPYVGYRDVFFDGERFVIVGSSWGHYVDHGHLEVSHDGQSWNEPEVYPHLGATLSAVAASGADLLAVGDYGTIVNIDGSLSTAEHPEVPEYMPADFINQIAVGPDRLYAAGHSLTVGSSVSWAWLGTSVDGSTWVWEEPPLIEARAMAFREELEAILGVCAVAVREPGLPWSQVIVDCSLTALAAGDPGLVAGSYEGVYFSTDGWAWNLVSGSELAGARAIAWNGSVFLASLATATATSPDGTTWTVHPGNPGANCTALAAGPGIFVWVGPGGRIQTSVNGMNWIARPSGTDKDLLGVTRSNGGFVATGEGGTVLHSYDGQGWRDLSLDIPVPITLRAAGRVNGRYLVGGDGYLLMESARTLRSLEPLDRWLPHCN